MKTKECATYLCIVSIPNINSLKWQTGLITLKNPLTYTAGVSLVPNAHDSFTHIN